LTTYVFGYILDHRPRKVKDGEKIRRVESEDVSGTPGAECCSSEGGAAKHAAAPATQTRLAEVLEMDQGNISKLEKRTDMYLSTLRSYVEAMGGVLEIRAVFPDGEVKIDLLNKLSA
jgi:hypothetical protein